MDSHLDNGSSDVSKTYPFHQMTHTLPDRGCLSILLHLQLDKSHAACYSSRSWRGHPLVAWKLVRLLTSRYTTVHESRFTFCSICLWATFGAYYQSTCFGLCCIMVWKHIIFITRQIYLVLLGNLTYNVFNGVGVVSWFIGSWNIGIYHSQFVLIMVPVGKALG